MAGKGEKKGRLGHRLRYVSRQKSSQVNLWEKPRENRMWSGRRKVGLAKCFEEEH